MTTVTEIPAGHAKVRITHAVYGDKKQHTVRFFDGVEHKAIRFTHEEDALAKAREAVELIKRGDAAVLSLTTADKHAYVRCQSLLKAMETPVSVAVEEYVHAKNKLPKGVSLTEAVEFYLKRGAVNVPDKTVRDVVSEFLATKIQTGASEAYLKGMECNLRQFERAFPETNFAAINVASDVPKYLNENSPTPETWIVKFGRIRALFAFAVKRKYISPEALVDYDGVDRPLVAPKDIEVYTTQELRLILSYATPEMVPWLALGAFCGIRHAELNRLDWSMIDLKEGHIRLSAAKTKTRSTRMIPLSDNLKAWLTPYAKVAGPVCEVEDSTEALRSLTEKIQREHPGFAWKKNAMRHSWISYKLALTNDENAVSQMAGNSPAMIHKHYRALVSKSQAEEWFAVMPC